VRPYLGDPAWEGVPGDLCRYEAGDCLLGDRYVQTMGFARIGAVSTSVPSRLLSKSAGRCIAGMMKTQDELKERVQREQQLTAPDLGLDQDPAPRHGYAGPEGPHQGCRRNPSVRVVDPSDKALGPA
jgi:hypothetical protein